MKKAILLFVAIMVMISFIISAFATGDQLTEDSLILSEETKKEVRSWVDDEYAEVSFRRYYVSLWAGFYSYDNIDDVLADDWCLLGVSYKVVTKSGVKHLSEGVAGILENKSPPNEEAVNAAFTSEVSQYIAPDVIVYNTYYLDNESSHQGTAVYYKTNKGDFIYYNYYEIGEKLFPVEAFCAYQRAKPTGDLIGETDASESWDLSAYDFRSDSFDLDAPIPEGLLSAGTAPSEKTDIPWYAIGIGIGVCGIAAVVVIVSVRIRKRKG